MNNAPAALVKQVLGADGLQGGVPHWQALSPKPDTSNLAQPAVWESNTLSIVIVNWNSGPLLRACLDSIVAHRSELQEDLFLERLIVVENASTDDSATSLDYPELPLLILRNSANLGFAAACNQGARACGGEVILFLNPDAKLQRGSLRAPLELLASPAAQRVGMVGVQIVDDRGEVVRTCSRFPELKHYLARALGLDRVIPSLAHTMREWDHLSSREVDQVIGAFFMVRRSVFEQLGGFDERFFVYLEEVDFSRRAKSLGWTSFFLSTAQVYHLGGGSSNQVKGLRLFYYLRSRLWYGYKFFSPRALRTLVLITFVVDPLGHCLFLLLRGRFLELRDLLEAYRHLWRLRDDVRQVLDACF